jgi:DNA-binding protein HU-beta
MNKAELVAEVQKSLGADTSKAAAEKAVNAVLEAISKGVKDASKALKMKDGPAAVPAVSLIGFGTFSVTRRNARTGINPQTKEAVKIKASKAVKFKPGAGLKGVL